MTAQTKSKAAELIEEINDLDPRGRRDDLTIRRLRREADRIGNVDAALMHVLRGALAALTGDFSEMHSAHRAAIRLEPWNADAYSNYACSLFRTGHFGQAFDIGREALARQSSDLSMTERVLQYALVAGAVSSAADLLARAVSLAESGAEADEALRDRARTIVAFCGDRAISDHCARPLIDAASAVMHSFGQVAPDVIPSVLETDERPLLLYDFSVFGVGRADVKRMNLGFAERVASDDLLGDLGSTLVVRFVLGAVLADGSQPQRVA